jgi:hypothetical protein
MKRARLVVSFLALAAFLACRSTPGPEPVVETPTFSPPGGTYATDQAVTIACATPGAAIHYTTDGSTPGAGSPAYAGPIAVRGNGTSVTIRAIGVKAGMQDSIVSGATYVIAYVAVAQPTFSPPGGTYATDQAVTIASATPGAEIHYTTDGSMPTGASARYTAPVAVAGMGTRITLIAVATKAGMADSPVATATFLIKILASYTFVALPGNPNDVVHDPFRGRAYVSNRTLDRIDVVGIPSLDVLQPVPVSGSPRGMAISPDGSTLYATLYDKWQMAVVDLNTLSQVSVIDLPAPAYPGGVGPLRVDFDAAGTCIWRDATEGHAFGHAYVLDVASRTSTPLFADETDQLRYAPSFARTRFLLMSIGGKAAVWTSATQASSAPVSVAGFSGGSWATWMNQGAIDDSGEIVLLVRFRWTGVYDGAFGNLGSMESGIAWATFGPWPHRALVVPGDDERPTATVSLLDPGTLGIVDSISLPEVIGYGEYNFGGQPIFLTADGRRLLVVGQTGLFVVETSTAGE